MLDVEVVEILALDVLELDVNAERGSKGISKKTGMVRSMNTHRVGVLGLAPAIDEKPQER